MNVSGSLGSQVRPRSSELRPASLLDLLESRMESRPDPLIRSNLTVQNPSSPDPIDSSELQELTKVRKQVSRCPLRGGLVNTGSCPVPVAAEWQTTAARCTTFSPRSSSPPACTVWSLTPRPTGGAKAARRSTKWPT